MKKLSMATAGAALIALGTAGATQAATLVLPDGTTSSNQAVQSQVSRPLVGSPSSTSSLTFFTSDSEFTPGVPNQGWWSPTSPNYDANSNYIVGICCGEGNYYHNFFTFDLSSLTDTVISARLELQRYGYLSPDPSETLGLFAVSTDAATLNNNIGTSSAIFNDLGTGTSYGSFVVSSVGSLTDILSFNLNAAAIADINAGAGGFFSIGGALLSLSGGTNDEFVFGSSHEAGRLVIETRSQSVPEPSSILGLVALSAFGAGSLLKRKQEQKA
jgi:hypothetical protein